MPAENAIGRGVLKNNLKPEKDIRHSKGCFVLFIMVATIKWTLCQIDNGISFINDHGLEFLIAFLVKRRSDEL